MRPTDKYAIERFFRTVASGFSQHCAGYKGNSVANRGVHPEKEARWTIEELEDFFAEWVHHIYHRRPHASHYLPWAGEPMSPNEALAAAVAASGYLPVPPHPDAYYELLPAHRRKINGRGVEIGNLFYNSAPLQALRSLGRSPEPGGKWAFRVDPRDVRQAYFKGTDGAWQVAPWVESSREIGPFSRNIADEAVRVLKARGVTKEFLQVELAADIEAFTSKIAAPETWKATGRKGLIRAQVHAQQAARDRARGGAAAPVGSEPALDFSEAIDLADLDVFRVVDFGETEDT